MSSYLHMSGDAAVEALSIVAAVRDDPARRLGLASRFYDDRPGCVSIRSYRRAEMAFMRWQVSAVAWYRAHNASIVAGYIEHHALCAAELPVERFFMNVALSRVLYAHALVASPKLALGRVRAVSRVLGDPRWRGADVFLSLHNILPDRYPLVGFTLSEILALENYAGRLIDYGVMLPRIQALYAFAAADLSEPRLLGFVQDGLPAYAWTNDEDHPWTTSRSPRLRSVLRWLTSS
jgi:hypothetical protein